MAQFRDAPPDREEHTPALLLWHEALSFIAAACEIPGHRTPRLHLAAHGIELALKSHLRAKGYSLEQLQGVGHSLNRALDRCEEEGLAPPSPDDRHRLDFISQAHTSHEWRYAHTDRPPHMEWEDWITVARWSLEASLPAVALSAAPDAARMPAYEWRMRAELRDRLDPENRG